MARFINGWIPVRREWLDPDSVFAHFPPARVVFEVLARLANVQDSGTLKKGQLMTGYPELMRLTYYSERTIRTALRHLRERHSIDTQVTPRGSIITILNYEEYFCIKTGPDTQVTPKRQLIEQETKDKRKQKDICKPPRKASGAAPDAQDLALAGDWHKWASAPERMPSLTAEPNKWADALRKARELDGRTHEQLRALFAFVQKDEFWCRQAYSPLGLRQKSKNGLTKAQNIEVAMKKAKPKSAFDPRLRIVTIADLKAEHAAAFKRSSGE